MVLSQEERKAKLKALASSEGYEHVQDLLDRSVVDSICPAICVKPDCSYTAGMEPDQDRGYCEQCGSQTVQSALVLAGQI